MTTTTHSHRAWTDKGGHVTGNKTCHTLQMPLLPWHPLKSWQLT